MAGAKFKCKICGKEYSCCDIGLRKHPYKQIVCSEECWQQWLSKINKAKKATDVKVVEEPIVEATEEVAEPTEDVQPVVSEESPVAHTSKKKEK